MSLANKTILVTGAGGFIGSHLVERLVREATRVRAFVHYNALGSCGWLDHSDIKDEIEILSGDITDQMSVRSAMQGVGVVCHLAALIAIPYSYSAPYSYVNTNVVGTLNILQAAREADVDRIVHTSTSEVYGTARYTPIDEKHPLQGQSPYSASKIAADKLVEAFNLSYGLPVVTLRPFNTFGPRQSLRAVIPTIISQCLSAGSVVRLGHLSPTRDLNFVSDIVDGFVAAAIAPGCLGDVLNLGSGKEISIGDLAAEIARILNVDIEIASDDLRKRPKASEVDRLLADNQRAGRVLGWQPKIGLTEGLEVTIEWIRRNMDRYGKGQFAL